MLKFEWNALRVGDQVMAHAPWGPDFTLAAAAVVAVDTKRGVNGVAIRVPDGTGSKVVWPPYPSVHLAPMGESDRCWRCDQQRSEVTPS